MFFCESIIKRPFKLITIFLRLNGFPGLLFGFHDGLNKIQVLRGSGFAQHLLTHLTEV
jgi:hypothetical protein